ncbi:serine/threonine-protein kinase [Streptomyces poonensis]|uniref:Serine/threonine protein kinase n=1 Tax=Streptomyces poonensis TaxID=68255 RepID=A0A918PMJ3_9ACTN|nr:serine/threonine-protein kinase [Streptomyces poonensis]GGZ15648.1 serine/threonine protein kinase [Streptomyces poonensis]GLJ91537.1 serine/threonine protein kinase [Streptomyces poonensis]
MQPLEAGEPTVVGSYRLLGRLGSGGMGRVYLGRSAGGRTVAVKIVHPHFALDDEFRARFRREVEAARRVGGAWTAPVLDADPEAPVPWVATAYAAGPSLTSAVADHGPLPPHSVRVLGAGLAEALSAVHALGLVHRDVKPSNVLLTVDGPVLIDFGIARATDGTASLTSTGVSIGSPGYMSPEQILGKGVTGAADVFSLGAVLAYAATGEPPFPGDSSAALLYKVVHEEPELGSLEGGLRELVERCLRKEPGERPGPGEVARLLAPEGAARAVSAGWLPGPLVERMGRSAVQLLNLEAVETRGSGPVEFSRVSVEGGSPMAAGVFGPPPVMSPEPREQGAGKVSVSVAATSVPGANGRGRKVSCTVALAVAGACAAVTLGLAFVPGLLRGGSDDDGAGGGSDQANPPAATAPTASAPTASPSAGAVPERYLGTWEGKGFALSGTLPMGTFRVTLGQVAVGEEVGTLRQTDPIGGVCEDVLILKKVTERRLVASGVGSENDRSVCTDGEHTVTFTPVGDDLTYVSDNAEAGDPEARMSKVE